MKYILLTIIILAALLIDYKIEKFSGGSGALLQLYAKGPQDLYLTKDAEKHMFYYMHPYREFIWNNPTRLYRYPFRYNPFLYHNYVYPFYLPY
jgi:hypothetical protein